MSGNRIVVGQSEWTFAKEDAADVVARIESALSDGTVVRLSLIDGAGRPVQVFINGRSTETVVIDLGESPRPSEIS
jgi:hypothetical protein